MNQHDYLHFKQVLIACLLTFGISVSAQLPTRFTGLRDNSIFGMSMGTTPADAQAAQNLGIKWVRNGIDDDWSDWNNSTSQINDLRSKIDQWHAKGVRVMPILWYPPNMKPFCCGPNVPVSIPDYVNLATSYVNALIDKEQNFEHWNEPWIGGWAWNSGTSDDYRNAINGIWDNIKPNHPEANFLGGGSVAFNRDVLWVPGTNSEIGKCDGSISHGYGVPSSYQLGIHYTQMELDKKYSPTQGRAGAWQTEIGVSNTWFASDGETWAARGVGSMYMTHWMAGFLAKQPVKLFWFEYSGADGANWQLQGKPAEKAYAAMTQIMEATKVTAALYPASKAVFALVAENDGSNDTRTRAAVWVNSIYAGDVGNPWDPQGNVNITPGNPSDMYSGTMSISGSGIQAYDYLGNRISDLTNITLNPLQVVYFLSTQNAADLTTSLNNAEYHLKTECLVYPLSLSGLIVNGRTIDIEVQNVVNKPRGGVLSITPPTGWTVSKNNIRFDNLLPGEKRIISFPISGFATNVNNKYPMSYTLSVDGKTTAQTGNNTLQVAYAPKKTITVDGDISDWNDIVAADMGSGAYKFRTAWDNDYFYYEAEIKDATHDPFGTWASQKDAVGLEYADKDGVLMYIDCFKDNPDDLFRDSPYYEKGCAADVDYSYMASLTKSNTSELIRYRAPGTNHEGYYPLNQPTNPPLGPVDAKLSINKYWRPGDGKTYYEGAISWDEIPQLKKELDNLNAGQIFYPSLAWQVNGGDAGTKYWTHECNMLEDCAYGYMPMWMGEMVQSGGRIISRWSFVNGNGSAPDAGACTGVSVKGVKIDSATLSLSVNRSQKLTPVFDPDTACIKSVTWVSTNTTVATVNGSGMVTGVAEGSAKIIVTTADGNKTDTCLVTVKYVPVTGITISSDTIFVDGTRSANLLATILPSNASDINVSWTTSDAKIAIVSGGLKGTITGVSPGTCTITVATTENSKKDSVIVIVKPIPVTAVSFSTDSAVVGFQRNATLTLNIIPKDATNKALLWASSDTLIAKVDTSGKVTGIALGSTLIVASSVDGDKKDTCYVTVAIVGGGLKGEYYNTINLTGAIALTRIDPTIDFDWGTNAYADGQSTDNFSARWTGQVMPKYSELYTFETEEDDGAKLWVDGKSLITDWGVGHPAEKHTGTITLTAGLKYNIKMEYYEATGGAVARLRWSSPSQTYEIIPQDQLYDSFTVIPVTGISIAPHTADLKVNGKVTLTASVSPANATNQTLIWSSSSDLIAMVDGNGNVTAKAEGNATITVKTADGGKTDNCTVTVTANHLGINNNQISKYALYPNPFKNELVISGQVDEVSIYRIDGKLLRTEKFTDHISTSDLGSGIYFVKVQKDGYTNIKKCIKE